MTDSQDKLDYSKFDNIIKSESGSTKSIYRSVFDSYIQAYKRIADESNEIAKLHAKISTNPLLKLIPKSNGSMTTILTEDSEELDILDVTDSTGTVGISEYRSSSAFYTEKQETELALAEKDFVRNFLQLIEDSIFEFGFKNAADEYVQNALVRYRAHAREWINTLFNKEFNNPETTSSILRVIAHFDFSQMRPQGVTMATAALSHDDIEVKECGVRCFENWESPENIHILESVDFSDPWLEEYVDEVISNLQEIA